MNLEEVGPGRETIFSGLFRVLDKYTIHISIGIIASCLTVGGALYFSTPAEKSTREDNRPGCKKNLLEKVRRLSDVNGNGDTSAEEWKWTYEDLGLVYKGKEGKDLPDEKLQRFISMYERR